MTDLSTDAQPGGVRMRYADAPRGVHDWVERELGSAGREVVDCSGGFSPGPAARLTCASGRRAFVKAVGVESSSCIGTYGPTTCSSTDVARVVCAVAMAWRHTSRSTDVGLPSLRPWQRRWADSLTGWLRALV